jgi:hypothetical protein
MKTGAPVEGTMKKKRSRSVFRFAELAIIFVVTIAVLEVLANFISRELAWIVGGCALLGIIILLGGRAK